jgi:hypothetical protein
MKAFNPGKNTAKLAMDKILDGVNCSFVGANNGPAGKIGIIGAQKLYYIFRIL